MAVGLVQKGAALRQMGWRTVKVPGSAHTQWLDASKIYSREAEWVSSKEWWYKRNFAVPSRFADIACVCSLRRQIIMPMPAE